MLQRDIGFMVGGELSANMPLTSLDEVSDMISWSRSNVKGELLAQDTTTE
jgi:hypothetical protein